MQMLNKLLNPVVMLATGFVLGLGATNYFAASGNEGKEIATVTTKTAAPELSETNTNLSSTTLDTPIQQVASVEPATQDRVAVDMLSEDVSLTETVDVSRQETAATEPSPEELAYSHPVDQATAPRLSAQETDFQENQLRLKSETTVATPITGNEGLLPHEIL